MSPRRLLWALLALALVWAPVAVQNGQAMASAPADHTAQMMRHGHCDDGPTGSQDKAPTKSCCAGMATSTEAPAGPALEPHEILDAPERQVVFEDGPGFLVELPTPPPRRA